MVLFRGVLVRIIVFWGLCWGLLILPRRPLRDLPLNPQTQNLVGGGYNTQAGAPAPSTAPELSEVLGRMEGSRFGVWGSGLQILRVWGLRAGV